jgi:hypothetical protein
MLRRYDLDRIREDMRPAADGVYVRYEDIAPLLAVCAAHVQQRRAWWTDIRDALARLEEDA